MRPSPRPEVYARLERELNVIEEVGYAEYFLIFADIVALGQPPRHRDAGAGERGRQPGLLRAGHQQRLSLPLRPVFERFLNRERMQFAKLADIDLDLPWDRRDEVIQYVFDRYGAEHVAMIGAFNTFQGRAAVADIAKVYGIPEREVRRFTEHLPYFMGDAEAVVQTMPECRHLPWQRGTVQHHSQDGRPLRGHPAARLDASLRPGDQRRAHHRPHAAVPQRQGLPDHALRHGRRRGTGAAEDGPAGAGGPDRAAGRARQHPREPRASRSTCARSTTRMRPPGTRSPRATRAACSTSNRRP